MNVGDLVREIRRGDLIKEAGIVIRIIHPRTSMPDYRTPTSVLVFYGTPQEDEGKLKNEVWYTKSELKVVSESR